MKFTTAVLAWATAALAHELQERGGYEHETTLTTYTTVTTCPVTSTYTKEGSTYCVTELTTSTITVTECHGCGSEVTTVPGPVVTEGTTTEVEITYTTVCPVTETVTGAGKTYLTTYTTTSVCTTWVPTTYYKTVPGPAVTKTAVDTAYETITSLCPVTKVTTLGGKEVTVTYTTTEILKTNAYTTIYETYQAPGYTTTEVDTAYKTITSLCPVTKVTTIAGKEVTVTYTTTEIIKSNAYTTIYETETGPGYTTTEIDTAYKTITSLCPVTKVTTIAGKEVTVTYTTTEIIKSNAYTTIYETETGPGYTTTEVDTAYKTITSLCPVTKVTTIGGKEVTVTYTTTEIIKTNAYTTIYETEKAPDTTKVAYETEYGTITSLCPVTKTTTINGQEVYITYTTTEYIKTNAYTTIYETEKAPDTTKVSYETEYDTITSLCPVTLTTTINGKVSYITYTSTEYIKTNAYTTIYETEKLPDVTKTNVEVAKTTITSLCPVTETKTVNGEVITETYTSTEVIVTQIPTVVEETKHIPGYTETTFQVQYSTITSLCPVTETQTINGEKVTKVYTSTQILYTKIPTTIEAYKTIYETVSGQEVQTQYSKVYYTVGGGTVYHTVPGQPTTKVVPQTSVVSYPPVTVTTGGAAKATTAPVEVPTGAAQINNAPGAVAMAGFLGVLALF